MWVILILLILLVLLYFWSTYSCPQPTLVPLQPEPIEEFPEDEIPFEMQQPIFTEPEICTSRDPVFEIRSHSIS